MKRLSGSISMLGLFASVMAAPALAQAEVKVVASIKPIHSLVASVMEGVGEPQLVVEGAGSPHTYSLRPSTARKLANADVVFWIGPKMESFLETPLENLVSDATVVSLKDAHDLKLLNFRAGGSFEKHGHDDHDDHAGETPEEHAAHADEAKADHDHDEHGAETFDMHLWLSPHNAVAMLNEIEETLSKADPANAEKYKANAKAEAEEINKLSDSLKADLENYQNKPFVVFHDGYRYFEDAYNLTAVGSVTVSPEVLPGAKRLSEVRATLENLGAHCVFSEPQFNPRMVAVLKEGTSVNSAELDPLGASLEAGPHLYTQLLKNMGAAFKDCLADKS